MVLELPVQMHLAARLSTLTGSLEAAGRLTSIAFLSRRVSPVLLALWTTPQPDRRALGGGDFRVFPAGHFLRPVVPARDFDAQSFAHRALLLSQMVRHGSRGLAAADGSGSRARLGEKRRAVSPAVADLARRVGGDRDGRGVVAGDDSLQHPEFPRLVIHIHGGSPRFPRFTRE